MSVCITKINGWSRPSPLSTILDIPIIAPVIVDAGMRIDVGGDGFTDETKFFVIGVPMSKGDHIATRITGSGTNLLSIYAPTVMELQHTSVGFTDLNLPDIGNYTYERNAILIPVAIKAITGNEESKPVLFGIRLPLPSIASVDTSGSEIIITGNALGNSEIRWYEPSKPQTNFSVECKDLLAIAQTQPGDAASLITSLGTAKALCAPSYLSGLREAGKQIVPISQSDNSLRFKPLIDAQFGGAGMVVVWRDDLPANPKAIDVNPKISKINDVTISTVPFVGSFAPVVVTPEGTLSIFGRGLKPGFSVKALGIRDRKGNDLSLRLISRMTDLRVTAIVPSMDEIQSTHAEIPVGPVNVPYTYRRNSLLFPLTIQVCNTDGTKSLPVALGIRLPSPTIGKPVVTNGLVQIGNIINLNDTRDLGIQSALGADGRPIPKQIGGQIRLYGTTEIVELTKKTLQDLASLRQENLASRLPDFITNEAWSALAEIRDAGRFIKPEQWNTNGAQFRIPSGASFGLNLIVFWREDIPSAPIPVWNWNYTCDQRNAVFAMLQEALDKIWKLYHTTDKGSFGSNATVTIPALAPGEWAPLVIEYVEQFTNNLLDQLLRDKPAGFDLKLWIDLTDENNQPIRDNDCKLYPPLPTSVNQARNQLSNPFLPSPSQVNQVYRTTMKFLIKPLLASDSRTIKVRLKLAISLPGSTGCPLNYLQIGPTFEIKQKSIEIPTVGVFFTGDSCGLRPLLVLPKSQTIIEMNGYKEFHCDLRGLFDKNMNLIQPRDNSLMSNLQMRRQQILSILSRIAGILDMIMFFYPKNWLKLIDDIITRVSCTLELGIDTTGNPRLDMSVYNFDKWGNAERWYGRIEYILLIGPPGSKVEFVCQAPNNKSMNLSIPDDTLIAGLKAIDSSSWLGLDKPKGAAQTGTNWSGQITSITIKET